MATKMQGARSTVAYLAATSLVALLAVPVQASHALPGQLGYLIPIVDGVQNRVFVVDGSASPPTLMLHISKSGDRAGEINQPAEAAIDPAGRVWVTDTLNHRIQVFDLQGRLLKIVGSWGGTSHQFDQPSGITISTDARVFVTDAATQRVTELDKDMRIVASWPTAGNGSGQLVSPLHVAVDSEAGRIYVIDILARIQLFDLRGRYLGNWGTVGFGLGQLRWPQLAVAHDGSLYATDESLQRISKFDRDGNPLKSWGAHGINAGQFYIPRDVAVDGQDRVWVFDSGNRRLQVFDRDGRFLFEWGQQTFAPNPSLPARALPEGWSGGFGVLLGGGLIFLMRKALRRLLQARPTMVGG